MQTPVLPYALERQSPDVCELPDSFESALHLLDMRIVRAQTGCWTSMSLVIMEVRRGVNMCCLRPFFTDWLKSGMQ